MSVVIFMLIGTSDWQTFHITG